MLSPLAVSAPYYTVLCGSLIASRAEAHELGHRFPTGEAALPEFMDSKAGVEDRTISIYGLWRVCVLKVLRDKEQLAGNPDLLSAPQTVCCGSGMPECKCPEKHPGTCRPPPKPCRPQTLKALREFYENDNDKWQCVFVLAAMD